MKPWVKLLCGVLSPLLLASCLGRGARAEKSGAGGPTINLWYGNEQSFGELGNPQQWVNILGNISDPEPLTSLTYSLNGGPPIALAIGPSTAPPGAPLKSCPQARPMTLRERAHRLRSTCGTEASFARCIGRHVMGRLIPSLLQRYSSAKFPCRLYEKGDFNVEVDTEMLRDGSNSVILSASDGLKHRATASVTVTYTRGRVWPRRYSVDWHRVSRITRAVQVVDGRWTKTSNGLRTMSMGYDRLFALGDVRWTDYEVTVPITIHAADGQAANNPVSGGSPGIGILLHWRGHSFSGFGGIPECPCWQPRCGAPPILAAWYDFQERKLRIDGALKGPARVLQLNTPYIWKVRSETLPRRRAVLYRMRVWKMGDREPANWDVQGLGAPDRLTSGSVLFDAHHVDATFGDISVVPGPFTDESQNEQDPRIIGTN